MAERRVQRRLAAILSADVVGYSRLMGDDETGTLERLKKLRNDILHPKVSEYGGRIVKTTGDGTLIEFPSAVDAVNHAIDVQQSMGRRNVGEDGGPRIEFRMGINVGDVIVDEEDIFGDGVNVAARIEALADPGGICISGTVYDQVRGKLDLQFRDLGEQSLKNIAEPVRVIAIGLEAQTAISEETTTADSVFRRPAVAVLPFENLSGDPDQEYFADGLTEDIITALALWRSFRVIARNSTFSYKGQSPDIRKVGEELGARYVIEGSVRKIGLRVRVTAQLINADSGHHIWAERFDRDIEDVFELQDELTGRIAATVAPEVERTEAEQSVTTKPTNLEAWDYLQRGMFGFYKFTKEGYARARQMFERAIELDPDYSRAHAALAYNDLDGVLYGFVDYSEKLLTNALDTARRAVNLDDLDGFAHKVLGIAYAQARQLEQGRREIDRALELNPSDATALIGVGHLLTLTGHPNEGISRIERGLQLSPRDPRNPYYFGFMARAQFTARRYEDAVEWARRSLQRRPNQPEPHLILAASLGHLGLLDEARVDLECCERLSPGYARPSGWVHTYANDADNEHFLDGLRKAGLQE